MEYSSYGFLFHMYLRKYSDTDWSSLLWNMIHMLTAHDERVAEQDRVWISFVNWCAEKWKQEPTLPFYDIAVMWTASDAVPFNTAGLTFSAAIRLCDEQTRKDLNSAAAYDLADV
jgi:hypothetical protein